VLLLAAAMEPTALVSTGAERAVIMVG